MTHALAGDGAVVAAGRQAVHAGRLEQIGARARDFILDLPQRGDVIEDPEASAVCRDDQIVSMHRQITHRGRRQIQSERLPVIAVVERDKHRAFGAGEQ